MSALWQRWHDDFRLSLRVEITVAVTETNNGIGVRHVHPLRIVSDRMKRGTKRQPQAGGKCLVRNHFIAGVREPQHPNLPGSTLSNEYVAIRCNTNESRLVQSAGEKLDSEPRRYIQFGGGRLGNSRNHIL